MMSAKWRIVNKQGSKFEQGTHLKPLVLSDYSDIREKHSLLKGKPTILCAVIRHKSPHKSFWHIHDWIPARDCIMNWSPIQNRTSLCSFFLNTGFLAASSTTTLQRGNILTATSKGLLTYLLSNYRPPLG